MRFVDPSFVGSKSQAVVGEQVVAGHFPGWLSKRIRKAYRALGGPEPRYYYTTENAARFLGAETSWFDHWGSLGRGADAAFVCEPYDLSYADMLSLFRFCGKVGLQFMVTAISWHYPTCTVRIVFYPEESTLAVWKSGTSARIEGLPDSVTD